METTVPSSAASAMASISAATTGPRRVASAPGGTVCLVVASDTLAPLPTRRMLRTSKCARVSLSLDPPMENP
ncbi:hypothetical protein GCM10019017_48650 [Streptomyces showdoensis]